MKLSAIIPTWNEAAAIGGAVDRALGIADEVIVADARSPDGTAEIAQAHGARVVHAPKSRGAQLHAGATASEGDVLLFLHADAALGPRARDAIEHALLDPHTPGGNFYLRFDSTAPIARFYTWANHVRRALLSVYYGDSAIFVRRDVYERLGGFSALPIMEDYELVRRLERDAGKTAYIRDVVVTVSARRFERAPIRTLGVWAIVHGLYCAGMPADRLAPLYRDIRGGH